MYSAAINRRGPEIIAVIMLMASVVAGVALALGRAPMEIAGTVGGVDLGLRFDVLAVVLLGFIASLGLLVAVFARRNLEGQRRRARFDTALAGALAALGVMVTGASLPVIALGWTISGIATVVLVGHASGPAARRASRYVARCLVAGDVAMWSGVIVAIALLPTVNRAELGAADLPALQATIVTLLLAGAGIARSGLWPVDRWLPETAEAPSPVSAMLHAGVINGTGVLAALAWPLFLAAPATLMLLLAAGVASVIAGTWGAAVRRDVKGRLACSTTAQMGYMSIQVALGLPAAAVLHLIGHGYYKSWSFLRAGGSVSRVRVGTSVLADRGRGQIVPAAVAALAVGLALALAPLTGSIDSFGPTALVPIAAALAAGAVLAALAARTRMSAVGAIAGISAGGVIAGGYAWLLAGWERLLAPSLPEAPAWTTVIGVALIIVVAAMALLAIAGVQRIKADPTGRLACAMTLRALPTWVRRRTSRTTGPPGDTAQAGAIADAIAEQGAAPTWPLRSFVASSALANLGEIAFVDAVDRAGLAMPSPGQCLSARRSGRLTDADLAGALERARRASDPRSVAMLVERAVAVARPDEEPDKPSGAAEEASMWCQRAWSSSTDLAGVSPWRLFAESHPSLHLPADPHVALGWAPPGMRPRDTAAALLAMGPGWTAHAAWRARELSTTSPLIELAALRAVLCRLHGESPAAPRAACAAWDDCPIWLDALEAARRRPLLDALACAGIAGDPVPVDAEVQVLFCIDVRSEPMRRALEHEDGIETFGVAGFFGVPLREVDARGGTSDQCPVLLSPTACVHEAEAAEPGVARTRTRALSAARAPLAQLVLAEALGVTAGAASLLQTLAPRAWAAIVRRVGAARGAWPGAPVGDAWGDMDHDARVDVAEGVLRSIGLTDEFAPLLVLCAHAASAENNAYATAYDCGACGGNGGQANARALAAMLNDAGVRRDLAVRGIVIPPGTVAVPALHDTTRQAIEIDPRTSGDVPAGQLDRFRHCVGRARVRALAERLPVLPGAPAAGADAQTLLRHAERRARDWSQAFPEWGLAGNAMFVAGPRSLTRGLDLGGQVFLHSYHHAADSGLEALELILSAPVVVAHWISMQYGLSSAAPATLGAGDKTTHNVVGDVGVLSGAHGDLRQGLPWQALYNRDPAAGADGCMHDPVRLLVVVAAPPEAVDEVLARAPGVAALVRGGWIALATIDATDRSLRRREGESWVPWLVDGCATQPAGVPVS